VSDEARTVTAAERKFPWLIGVFMLFGLLLIYGGYSTYADRTSGTKGTARVTGCEGGRGKYDRAVRCRGSWVVGGELIGRGGRLVVGPIEGAGYRDVGKELDVRIHDDHATKPELGTPIMLAVLGLPIVGLCGWGLVNGVRRRNLPVRPAIDRSPEAAGPGPDPAFAECVVNIEETWGDPEGTRLESYATPWLCDSLRNQAEAFRARGRIAHQRDTQVERLEVIAGGGARDSECVLRVTSTSNHWVTDAETGAEVSGSPRRERVSRYWRFVRDPDRGWLADEIGVEPPAGWPAVGMPEPVDYSA
jgi:hypothetical protein